MIYEIINFIHRQVAQNLIPFFSPFNFFSYRFYSISWIQNNSWTFCILLNLLKKICSDFKIWSSWIDELKCFKQWPLKLFHEIYNSNNRGPILSSNRMNQHSCTFIKCFINKSNNFFWNSVLFIKY